MKQFYFIRHGQTNYNVSGKIQGSGINSSINELGQKQGQSFFDAYRNIGFECCFTSALKRTEQTIAPFIQLGIPHYSSPLINEMNWGIIEGKHPSHKIQQQLKRLKNLWIKGQYEKSIENGESPLQVAQRLEIFLQDLKSKEESKILVCTHGRTLRVLKCLIFGLPLSKMDSFNHSNTGLFLTEWSEQSGWNIVYEDDTSHLAALNQLS